MCTLTIAWQVFEAAPVAVAANRDESLEREATPPTVFSTEPTVIAPRDARAGGTWIGVNEHGVFAGITNRWTDAELAGERSRGLLVADVLECRRTETATTLVTAQTDAHEYDGFNLVLADSRTARVLEWDGTLTTHDLTPGVHVVFNTGFDETVEIPRTRTHAAREQATNASRVRQTLTDALTHGDETDERPAHRAWLERAGSVLADHEYGVCVHGDGFGTRSSSLIALGEAVMYDFAPGPPCRTPYASIGIERQI